jgi:hypothetical protein
MFDQIKRTVTITLTATDGQPGVNIDLTVDVGCLDDGAGGADNGALVLAGVAFDAMRRHIGA